MVVLPFLTITSLILYATYFKKTAVYESRREQTPYPLLSINNQKDVTLIKRGEYIAKMGNCISCHTLSSKKKATFAGGVLIDTPFGSLYSTNITPDKETGIGSWREKDFFNAMKKGVSPSGTHYFPAFPYPYFSLLKRDDIHALYLYLKAIPSIKQKNHTNPYPYNMPFARQSMSIWNHFFMPKKAPNLSGIKLSKRVRRGDYLVNGPGHCSLCHTPLNLFGAPKTQYFLSGTFLGGYWAPNISSAGLKRTSLKAIVNTFDDNHLLNNAGPLAGPMTDVTLNSLSYLSYPDKLAIASYLKTVKSRSKFAVSPDNKAPTLSRGRYIYKKVCVICHQDGEMGAPRIGNRPGWLSRLARHGLDTFYARTINGFNNMPAFGGCVNCSDNDIKAAVNYLLYQSLPYSKWKKINE